MNPPSVLVESSGLTRALLASRLAEQAELAADDVPDALDGRGIGMLEACATRWGVRVEAIGKTVWFELRIVAA